jgi:hypothetical protein
MATDDTQQERTTRHAGHTIVVTATRSAHHWAWSYLIDGRTYSVGKVPCSSCEQALHMGLAAAKARVEGMT